MEEKSIQVNDVPETPKQLIALALEKQADPIILSKLMDLQERWEAVQAKKAYVAAMAAFKREAPAVLKKCDVVDFTTARGRTKYNYANLGSIVQEITAVLGKHELSASWSTSQEGTNVTVTCHVTHIAGHRESVTLTGPIDESGNKNRIQAVGSTVTYLQRYTLLAALGLATGEDDDGRGGAEPGKPPNGKTVGEGQAVEEDSLNPVHQPPSPSPAESIVINSKIDAVTKYEGKKGNKEYTIYNIVIGENKISTFDKPLAQIAKEIKTKDLVATIEYKQTDKGLNLVSIKPLEEDNE